MSKKETKKKKPVKKVKKTRIIHLGKPKTSAKKFEEEALKDPSYRLMKKQIEEILKSKTPDEDDAP